jgi:hypothetical protein
LRNGVSKEKASLINEDEEILRGFKALAGELTGQSFDEYRRFRNSIGLKGLSTRCPFALIMIVSGPGLRSRKSLFKKELPNHGETGLYSLYAVLPSDHGCTGRGGRRG